MVEDGWGFVEIEGLGRFRDVKLWPGGGRAWDWRETGTDHRPGVLSSDVEELLNHEPDLVISAAAGRAGWGYRRRHFRYLTHVACRSCTRRLMPRWRHTAGWQRKVAESQDSSIPPVEGSTPQRPAYEARRSRHFERHECPLGCGHDPCQ